jgi:hypothetical protein
MNSTSVAVWMEAWHGAFFNWWLQQASNDPIVHGFSRLAQLHINIQWIEIGKTRTFFFLSWCFEFFFSFIHERHLFSTWKSRGSLSKWIHA